MQVKIRIKTPKGLASGVVSGKNFLLLRMLFGMKKTVRDKVITNKKEGDDEILWLVETDYKGMMNITKRITLFETLISGVFGHKWMKAAIKKGKLSEEDQKQLEYMLKEMTKIEIVKSDARDLVD